MEEAKRKLAIAEKHLEDQAKEWKQTSRNQRILSSVMFVVTALAVTAAILGFNTAESINADLATNRQALANTNYAVCTNAEGAFTSVTTEIPGESRADYHARLVNLRHRLNAAALFGCDRLGFNRFDIRRRAKLREIKHILGVKPKKHHKARSESPAPTTTTSTPLAPVYVAPSSPSSSGGKPPKKKGHGGVTTQPGDLPAPAPVPPPVNCPTLNVLGICI